MKEKHPYQMNMDELREQCRDRGIAAEETATKPDLIDRIVLFDAGMKQAGDLPPPGFARDEELARRKDALEERIEDPSTPEIYPVDPGILEEDREILHKSFDQQMLEISNKQPGYMYCWTYYGLNGHMVYAKKSLGWRVVTASDPECSEHKEADGTRRIGDVLLMRIPIERFNQIEEEQAKRRQAQELGVHSRLSELADKARSHGIKIHQDLSTVKVGPDTLMDVVEKRSGAKEAALKTIDKKLRDGSVPGMPSPND
jgi:hypothetical protein